MQLNIYAGYKKHWRNREVEEGEAWIWRSRMGEFMNREWLGFGVLSRKGEV